MIVCKYLVATAFSVTGPAMLEFAAGVNRSVVTGDATADDEARAAAVGNVTVLERADMVPRWTMDVRKAAEAWSITHFLT
ncbi:MAG: hypothetical protein ACK56I_15295 [bacterium]